MVTVFVAAVFSVIYINFYPLVGEYERRDFYDDLDSKYGAYWIKVFLQDDNYSFSSISTFLIVEVMIFLREKMVLLFVVIFR